MAGVAGTFIDVGLAQVSRKPILAVASKARFSVIANASVLARIVGAFVDGGAVWATIARRTILAVITYVVGGANTGAIVAKPTVNTIAKIIIAIVIARAKSVISTRVIGA